MKILYQDAYLNTKTLLSGFLVDNQGTAWLPTVGWTEDGDVEFRAQVRDVESGEEETWVWGMSDLPRSACGQWVAFPLMEVAPPLVEGLGEGMGKINDIPPRRKKGKEYFDFCTHETEPVEGASGSPTVPPPIDIRASNKPVKRIRQYPGRGMLSGSAFKEISNSTVLVCNLHDIATIRLLPPPSPTEFTHQGFPVTSTSPPHTQIVHGKWKSANLANTVVYTKHTFQIPPALLAKFNPWKAGQYWTQDFGASLGQSSMGPKLALWGYCVDNYSTLYAPPEVEGGSVDGQQGIVHLLPYVVGDEWVATGSGLEEVRGAMDWYQYGMDSGRTVRTVSMAWGDDGLVGWWAARVIMGPRGAVENDLWVVCWEEEWVVKGEGE